MPLKCICNRAVAAAAAEAQQSSCRWLRLRSRRGRRAYLYLVGGSN